MLDEETIRCLVEELGGSGSLSEESLKCTHKGAAQQLLFRKNSFRFFYVSALSFYFVCVFFILFLRLLCSLGQPRSLSRDAGPEFLTLWECVPCPSIGSTCVHVSLLCSCSSHLETGSYCSLPGRGLELVLPPDPHCTLAVCFVSWVGFPYSLSQTAERSHPCVEVWF